MFVEELHRQMSTGNSAAQVSRAAVHSARLGRYRRIRSRRCRNHIQDGCLCTNDTTTQRRISATTRSIVAPTRSSDGVTCIPLFRGRPSIAKNTTTESVSLTISALTQEQAEFFTVTYPSVLKENPATKK